MKTSVAIAIGVLILGSTAIPVQAAPQPLTNCAQVKALAPYGVAKNAKAVRAATKAGLVPPRKSKALYKRAQRLDKGGRNGYVCGTRVQVARQANAEGYFRGYDSRFPSDVVAGTSFAVEGSPAQNYLRYLSRSTEVNTWAAYQATNQVIPTVVAPTVTVTGERVTVVSGNVQQDFDVTFDDYGKLQTWTTEVGPLSERLFTVQGAASAAGVNIDVDWTYRTLRGTVVTTGYATNTSAQQIRLAKTYYSAPDGGTYEGYTTGTCIAPGQRIPIDFYTDAAAPSAASGIWLVEVLTCDFYNVGSLQLNFGPR